MIYWLGRSSKIIRLTDDHHRIRSLRMYRKYFKRVIDIIASVGLLVVLSPLLVVIAVLLFFFNEGAGILLFQERPGYKGKPFRIIKFKTMNERKGPDGTLLPDKQRITRFGAFVRNSSIDELPQLWNVLKGEMSLIGPRPLLMQYLPLYSAEQARRHEVRPGITGWAQCHGRNAISWKKKFELDVWYVDNITFKTDCSIAWTTLMKVLKRADTTSGTVAFNGHN